MGRSPCCDEHGVKKGPWDPEEDQKLMDYIQSHGHGSWRALPKLAGLKRCGKSCRLRWTNYLRPDIKRGKFSDEEEQIIVRLHSVLGNKWSAIAARLPGRTDNEIKNFWNTHMRKKLLQMGIDPVTHRPRGDLNLLRSLSHLLSSPNMSNSISHWEDTLRIQEDAKHLAKIQLLQTMLHAVTYNVPPRMEMPSFHNYQFNEMHLGPQCNRLPDGPMACTHDPIAIPCNFSNPASMQHSDYEALMKSCSPEGQETVALFDEPSSKLHISGNTYDSINVPGSYAVKPANPAPHLGSDAHELAVLDSKHDQINPTEKSSHSSTSFDPWGELTLDDQSSDYCWADIIKSSPPWEMKA